MKKTKKSPVETWSNNMVADADAWGLNGDVRYMYFLRVWDLRDKQQERRYDRQVRIMKRFAILLGFYTVVYGILWWL